MSVSSTPVSRRGGVPPPTARGPGRITWAPDRRRTERQDCGPLLPWYTSTFWVRPLEGAPRSSEGCSTTKGGWRRQRLLMSATCGAQHRVQDQEGPLSQDEDSLQAHLLQLVQIRSASSPPDNLKWIGYSPPSSSPKVNEGGDSEAVSLIRQERCPMRRAGIIVQLFLVIALPLCGQESYPKGEVLGGYPFSH